MKAKTYRTNIQAGAPTPRKGVIYSRHILQGAIREYLNSDLRMGMLEDTEDTDAFELDYSRISHNVIDVYIDQEGFLCVEVAFLDTEHGRIAALMPDLVEPSVISIGFCGWEDNSNVVVEGAKGYP